MEFKIRLKDINALDKREVSEIYSRLSIPGRNMREELEKRYITPEPGPHETMTLAMIYCNDFFVAWVGSRPFKEKFKGDVIDVQTIECFTEPELRQRGYAQLGIQALMTAGTIDRDKPVSVYEKPVVKMAQRCGCRTVLLCDSSESP